MITKEVVTLNTEWPFSLRWSGVFNDPASNEDLIFSGDPNTHMKVRVFSAKGDLIRNIPLGPALIHLGTINSLTLISVDSVFVIEEHGPHYVVIDSLGNVARAGSLMKRLCDTNGDLYSLNGYSNGLTILGSSIYAETDWVRACDDTTGKEGLSRAMIHQRFFEKATRKCKVAKVQAHVPDPTVTFGACDLLPHLTDTSRGTIGGVRRIAANGKLFVISPYSNYISQLDTGTMSVSGQFQVQYSKGEIGITPPPVSVEDLHNDGYNVRLATKAKVVGFVYDSPSDKYFAAVYHEVPESTSEEFRGSLRSWSLLEFDNTFTQLTENVVHSRVYQPFNLLSLQSGTFVMKSPLPGLSGATQPKVFYRIVVQ